MSSQTEALTSNDMMWDLAGGKTLQFVRVVDGIFEIDDEGIDFLRKRDKGIAFCSITGKFRSGKSFLLNKIMGLKPKKGFVVSPSVNACTRGLWLWTKPLFLERQNLEVFFVDTEGLDSPGKDPAGDAKLFALVVMISSFFIFNSNGYIDEPSIESLSLVTHLINNIAVTEDSDTDPCQVMYQLSQYAPSFLWVLRNVVLELQDLKGRPATAAMYLESSLTDVPYWGGQTRNYEQSFEIRKALLNFFKLRDCWALIRPHKDERVLQKLQDVPDASLQPEFMEGVEHIRQKILTGCRQKIIDGVPLTGIRMASFISEFVTAFNAHQKSIVSTAWRALLEEECEGVAQNAQRNYSEATSAFLGGFPEGIDPQQLHEQRQILRNRAAQTFSAVLYIEGRDEQLYMLQRSHLQQNLDELDTKIDKINEELCLQRCSDVLERSLYEFLTDPQYEGLGEYAIVERFAQRYLLPYLNDSPRIFNTRALAAKINELSRKIIESYCKFQETQARMRMKEVERVQNSLLEQLRAEEKTLAAYAEVVNALDNEAALLRRKYNELSSGVEGEEETPKIRTEFDRVKKQNETIELQMKDIGNKIGDIRSKIDSQGKKRWKICG